MAPYRIHPDMAELLAAKAAKPRALDLAVQREGHDTYGAALARDYPPGMQVADRVLDCPGAGRGGKVPVRIYRPARAETPAAGVMYVHGGGFVLGSLDSGDQIAAGIARETGAVVVSVDYRLAPEDPFPAAPEDCYAALRHVSRHPSAFGIDHDRIAIWGDSAGGNLAVATCMLARDRGGPKIAAQAVVYPTLIDRPVSRSHREHADSPGLGADFMERAWNAYLGEERGEAPPCAAPLAESADLAGLPPAHVHIAQFDPLADDGRDYVRRLLEAGVDAELHCARDMIHGFVRARESGPDAAAEFSAICRSLRAHLRIGARIEMPGRGGGGERRDNGGRKGVQSG